jgi:hypothetical protein
MNVADIARQYVPLTDSGYDNVFFFCDEFYSCGISRTKSFYGVIAAIREKLQYTDQNLILAQYRNGTKSRHVVEDSLRMLETKFCAQGLDKRSIVCTVVFALFWPEACEKTRAGPQRFREDMESIYKRMATFPFVRFILLPPPDLPWKLKGLQAAHADAPVGTRKWLKAQYTQWEQTQYSIAQELVQTQQRSNIIVVNPIRSYNALGLHTDGLHFSNADQWGPDRLANIFLQCLKMW